MKPKINIEDGVYAKADKELWPYLDPCMAYTYKLVRDGQHAKDIKTEQGSMLDKRSGKFLAGLLPRAVHNLQIQGVDFEITGQPPLMVPEREPTLKDIELRPEQLGLIELINAYQRGVIKAPTGSGKTIIALGAISQWPDARVLILTHRREILDQFFNRVHKHVVGYSMQTVTGDSAKGKDLTARIVIAMSQTLVDWDEAKRPKAVDILIVDEVHHAVIKGSQLSSLIEGAAAPICIGFTATPPDTVHDLRKALTLEGLVGPVIGDLTIKQGQELGIIARPYVTLLGVPYNAEIAELRRYRDLYVAGIVENQARNAIITKAAKARAMAGLSSLTIIKEIKHGELLTEMAQRFRLDSIFIHGGTSGEQREAVKEALSTKQRKNVIVTDIWREGVDIPTLDCVIMAAAPKGKIYTLQGVGRGMRTAEGKDRVEIVDFLDPYKYLARHCVARLNMYKEGGWL
jgi:superfamily II DNA or RNA helicase